MYKRKETIRRYPQIRYQSIASEKNYTAAAELLDSIIVYNVEAIKE